MNIVNFVREVGALNLFVLELLRLIVRGETTLRAISDQIWKITLQSLPTTAIAGFFVGAIMTIQFALQVKEFGALGFLGGLATSGTIREVGPLLIAFMLSGKVGAFTSAELGTMKVSEQIDAIRCLGSNPLAEIILPRFLGIIFSSFFLLAVGLLMSIGGGLLLGVVFAEISPAEYVRHIPSIVAWPSILSGLFKCFIFALVLASVCTFKGYNTEGGAKEVGKTVVQTAVMTMVGIVVADWVTSLLTEAVLLMVLES